MTCKLARVAIDLSVSDHKKLKTVASLLGMSMKDLVVVSVGDYVQKRITKVERIQPFLSSENKEPKNKKRNRKKSNKK